MQRPARRFRRKRVFVSFDYDNDLALRNLIIGQARLADSPFEVVDHSLKETAPEALWELKARRAIARSDVVIVMLGRRTRYAPGVSKKSEWQEALVNNIPNHRLPKRHERMADRWSGSRLSLDVAES